MTDLTRDKKLELFNFHRCPECGKYTLMFYYPGLNVNQEISQEIECESCGLYIMYTYNIDEIKVRKT